MKFSMKILNSAFERLVLLQNMITIAVNCENLPSAHLK